MKRHKTIITFLFLAVLALFMVGCADNGMEDPAPENGIEQGLEEETPGMEEETPGMEEEAGDLE